jgi:MFS family permease
MSPHHNRWLILAIVCLPVFIGALDLTIISAVLPAMVLDLEIPLETSLDDAAWAVSGYLMAYAITMSFMGRVSDLIGRRKVYLICLVVFIAGSWMVATCDQAPTDLLVRLARAAGHRPDRSSLALAALVIGRVVQALGAGAMVPISMALVGDLFPPERRAQPLGVVATVDTAGWVLGHLYGGLMVKWLSDLRAEGALQSPFFDWQILFLLNVPIGLAALALSWWVLRGVPQPVGRGRFDLWGALFLTLAHVSLNIGLGANVEATSGVTSFEELSQPPPYAGLMLAAAAAFLTLFIWQELRASAPLHNLRLFARRLYGAASATNLFVGFALMIGLVSVPLLINVRQVDFSYLDQAARDAGLLLSGLTVPMALAALPGGWLTGRFGYRLPTVLGLALAVAGFVTMGLTWTGCTPYPQMALHLAISGLGLGLTFSPISAAAVNTAPEGERGSVSALVIIIRLVGMTISMSSLTTYALRRVTLLTAQITGSPTFDFNAAAGVVFEVTVQVIRELMLFGGVVCLMALVPALLMAGQSGAASQPAGD